MSDGVDARELLEAVRRRGGYRSRDPRYGDFEATRQASVWTGVVFPQQQVTLRRNAMLILNARSVTVGIDTDAKRVQFMPPAGHPLPEPGTLDELRLEHMVFQVLGPGWEVSCGEGGTISSDDSRPARPARPAPQRERKRRPPKTRRRR